MYKVRIILDTKEDIFRTILVDNNLNLETLHFTIAKSFDFDGSEMASFYKTDNNWVEGEEIPLFNMSEAGESLYMKNCYINTTIPAVGDKLIYVYDFLKMWTFYVEVIETNSETNENLPKIILSVGEVPLQAPEKEFIAEKSDNSFEDEFNDEFESLDDIDFDRY